jgi:tripartite-type tricarboxylate transporter receptor subunit TctC
MGSVRFWRLGALACLLAVGPALAQTPADFYRGKTIQLVIGTGEGGGYDLSARLVAQFLPDFIPGRPIIVPRNMPGAGSIAAAEYVYSVAPRDGTVMAIVQPTFLLEKITDRSRKYEPEKFAWIGRVDQSVVMGVIWKGSPAQSVKEATQKQVVIAANGPAGTSATIPWALNKMLGTKYKVVLGYDSSATMGLALEKGEADALGSTSWDYLETKREWFSEGKATIPYVITLERFRKLPDVPTVLELVDNPRDKNALKLMASTSSVGRAFMSTPGVPPERIDILRKAFDAMVADPKFQAEAEKRRLGIDPMSGADVQKIIADVMGQPDEVVERMKEVTRPQL